MLWTVNGIEHGWWCWWSNWWSNECFFCNFFSARTLYTLAKSHSTHTILQKHGSEVVGSWWWTSLPVGNSWGISSVLSQLRWPCHQASLCLCLVAVNMWLSPPSLWPPKDFYSICSCTQWVYVFCFYYQTFNISKTCCVLPGDTFSFSSSRGRLSLSAASVLAILFQWMARTSIFNP